MTAGRFSASVQYDDFLGSCAADGADQSGPTDWLRAGQHIDADDFVLGIELWAGENAGAHSDPIDVHFLVVKGTFDSVASELAATSGAVSTRRVSVEMSITEFMGLFKRLNICLSPKAMLDGRKYSFRD